MSKINTNIFKGYDIRGIYPDEIDEKVIYKLTKAIFTFFLNKLGKDKTPRIVLSYDGRTSSPSLVKEVERALVESGAEVINIGLSGTPTFYFAVNYYGYDAGIQVSASHNPKEYNGLKFTIKQPDGLLKIGATTGLDEVKEIALSEEFDSIEKEGNAVQKKGVLEDQIRNSLEFIGNPRINSLKVVADAANAVGGLYLDKLFDEIPAELVKMNFEIDGSFPAHQPDPLQFDTLKDLQRKVVEEKADFGIAPDGDADRVFFIDEKGEVIPASLITSLISKELLRKNKGAKIVFDVRDTFNINHAVKESGGVPILTKVGHAIITETAKKNKAIFSGENSGHYFFEENGYAENPIPVVLTVLAVITKENKPISEILKPFAVSFESGEINFKTENAEKVQELLKEKYKDGRLSKLDGISIDYDDWRFNLRMSNTEPLMRLNVESFDEKLMEEKKNEIVKLIRENS